MSSVLPASLQVHVQVLDWSAPPADLTCDVILGSDLLYDPGAHITTQHSPLDRRDNTPNTALMGSSAWSTLECCMHSLQPSNVLCHG